MQNNDAAPVCRSGDIVGGTVETSLDRGVRFPTAPGGIATWPFAGGVNYINARDAAS